MVFVWIAGGRCAALLFTASRQSLRSLEPTALLHSEAAHRWSPGLRGDPVCACAFDVSAFELVIESGQEVLDDFMIIVIATYTEYVDMFHSLQQCALQFGTTSAFQGRAFAHLWDWRHLHAMQCESFVIESQAVEQTLPEHS